MRAQTFMMVVLTAVLMGCTTLKKPFLYKAQNQQGEMAYFLGTMHLGIPTDDLPSSTVTPFERANPVYVEVDLTTPSPLVAHQSRRMMKAVASDMRKSKIYDYNLEDFKADSAEYKQLKEVRGTLDKVIAQMETQSEGIDLPLANESQNSLKDSFNEKEWKFILKTLKPFYGREGRIEKLHPETVYVYVAKARTEVVEVSKTKAERLKSRWSMDLNLIKQAKAHGKIIKTLDTVEDFPADCMQAYYVEEIKNLINGSAVAMLEGLDTLEAHYRDGDEVALQNYIKSELGEKRNQCFLVNRNKSWLPKIQQQMKASAGQAQAPFFAFGVAHLFGETGILTLLENAGYQIERVQ